MNTTTHEGSTNQDDSGTKAIVIAVISWAIALWASRVFLTSIPYKFTGHPDTQHIFGTIGDWIGSLIAPSLGALFTRFGAYAVGSFEILASLVLLAPAVLWAIARSRGQSTRGIRGRYHRIGGLLASAVMAGAVFFHLFSPLGIEVLHQGQSDGGSLFYAALSILVLGIVLFVINRNPANP